VTRRAFTLIELLIVFAIICVLVALMLPFLGFTGSRQTDTFIAKVVRRYEKTETIVDNVSSVFRVEVQKKGSERIEVLENRYDWWHKEQDSATLQANLIEGHTYEFTTRGTAGYGRFPNTGVSARSSSIFNLGRRLTKRQNGLFLMPHVSEHAARKKSILSLGKHHLNSSGYSQPDVLQRDLNKAYVRILEKQPETTRDERPQP
jgi:prepilin-type N-terminal cleavage/methylation domain-containing protein